MTSVTKQHVFGGMTAGTGVLATIAIVFNDLMRAWGLPVEISESEIQGIITLFGTMMGGGIMHSQAKRHQSRKLEEARLKANGAANADYDMADADDADDGPPPAKGSV